MLRDIRAVSGGFLLGSTPGVCQALQAANVGGAVYPWQALLCIAAFLATPAAFAAPMAVTPADTMAVWFQRYDALDAMPSGPAYEAEFDATFEALGPHLQVTTPEGARRALQELRVETDSSGRMLRTIADALDAFLARLDA